MIEIQAPKQCIPNKNIINKKENQDMKSFNENIQSFINKTPTLLLSKKGKTIIKEFASLISSNTILKEQFNLYEALKEGFDETYTSDISKQMFINEINTSFKKYKKEDIIEANQLVENFINKYNIEKSYTDTIVDKAVDYLIKEDSKFNNLNEVIKQRTILFENIKIKKPLIEQSETDYDLLMSLTLAKLDNKIKKLNENDQHFIKKLMNANTLVEQQEVLDDIKNECLVVLNNLIKECNDVTEKERLLNHKENILNKVLNENNFESLLSNMVNYKKILTEINN